MQINSVSGFYVLLVKVGMVVYMAVQYSIMQYV